MSIVSSAAADGFIQRLPREIGFYLVHGLDEGLTHERVQAIVRSRIGDDTDPMRLVRFEGDSVARDPGALADEAYAISMFGGDPRSGSTRRDGISCRRSNPCLLAPRPTALSSSRPDSSRRERV